jgi:CRISPR-associated exonuclease Cas4
LDIVSHRLGLRGKADIVEFHRDGTVLPVEYKRGKPKKDDCDRVQLCAQALCLEEMLGISIPNGALFYGEKRRRHEVAFDEDLRATTEATACRLHKMIDSRITPTAVREPKCESCSLLQLCMPDALKYKRGAAAWLDRQLTTEEI